MGRPLPDDNLPEVTPYPYQHSTLPEVVPDSSPEALSPNEQAQHRQLDAVAATNKYPVQYDDAPKLPTEYSTYDSQSPTWPVSAGSGTLSRRGTIISTAPWDTLAAGENDGQITGLDKKGKEPRICGLRRRTFIFIIVLAVVVVAAIVGGVVGGTAKYREGSDQVATPPSPSSSPTSSPPSPIPPFLNNMTNPYTNPPKGIAFQAFERPCFEGQASQVFMHEGIHNLTFNATSYIWYPENLSPEPECGITFCKNTTFPVGWWADFRNRTMVQIGRQFERVHIWCGDKDWDERGCSRGLWGKSERFTPEQEEEGEEWWKEHNLPWPEELEAWCPEPPSSTGTSEE